jgi:hypothetical protein
MPTVPMPLQRQAEQSMAQTSKQKLSGSSCSYYCQQHCHHILKDMQGEQVRT